MRRACLALLRLPLDDYMAALARLADGFRPARLGLLIAAAVSTWWIYVPIHELGHAFGCLAGGGTVTRLEIDPLYGAALLQRVFPFVAVGSEYAGQLTGFDTRGSDLTYLLTDFLPFVLTIVVGVPALRAAGRMPGGPAQALLFGAALPVALAPFVSFTGDYYEMGSILVSRGAASLRPGFDVARWRSDDLFKLAGTLYASGGGAADVAGLAASFLAGVGLAFLTYACGALLADAARRRIGSPRDALGDRRSAQRSG